MHPPLPGDKQAGFIGLVAGGVSIFIVVYAIVLLTNKKFEGHRSAAAQHAPPPAAGTPAAGTPAPAPH